MSRLNESDPSAGAAGVAAAGLAAAASSLAIASSAFLAAGFFFWVFCETRDHSGLRIVPAIEEYLEALPPTRNADKPRTTPQRPRPLI